MKVGVKAFDTSAVSDNDEIKFEERFAQKLRTAEKQEKAGEMREYNEFVKEFELKFQLYE